MYIGPFYNCNHGASGIFTFVTSGLLMHIESGASYGFLGIRTPSHAHRVGRELPFFGLSRVFRGVCACVLHIGRRRGLCGAWPAGGAGAGGLAPARGPRTTPPRTAPDAPIRRPPPRRPSRMKVAPARSPPPPDVQNTRTNPAKNARKAEKR